LSIPTKIPPDMVPHFRKEQMGNKRLVIVSFARGAQTYCSDQSSSNPLEKQ